MNKLFVLKIATQEFLSFNLDGAISLNGKPMKSVD